MAEEKKSLIIEESSKNNKFENCELVGPVSIAGSNNKFVNSIIRTSKEHPVISSIVLIGTVISLIWYINDFISNRPNVHFDWRETGGYAWGYKDNDPNIFQANLAGNVINKSKAENSIKDILFVVWKDQNKFQTIECRGLAYPLGQYIKFSDPKVKVPINLPSKNAVRLGMQIEFKLSDSEKKSLSGHIHEILFQDVNMILYDSSGKQYSEKAIGCR